MTRTTTTFAALAAAATLALTGCAAGGLEVEDPQGYAACKSFSDGRASTDVEVKMNTLFETGELAAQAKTDAIREAASPLFDDEALESLEGTASEGTQMNLVDSDKMLAACTDAGFDVADVQQSD